MFDLDRFKSDLVKKILDSAGKANVETSKKVLEQKTKQFDNRGANDWDATEFPALEESTVRIKKSLNVAEPEVPLVRYGKLSRSLYMDDDEDFTSIRSRPVENEEGEQYNVNAKDFIATKSSGEPHFYDELSDAEQREAFKAYFYSLKDGLANGS